MTGLTRDLDRLLDPTELGEPKRSKAEAAPDRPGRLGPVPETLKHCQLSCAIVEVLSAAGAVEPYLQDGCNAAFARLKRAVQAYHGASAALGIAIPQQILDGGTNDGD